MLAKADVHVDLGLRLQMVGNLRKVGEPAINNGDASADGSLNVIGLATADARPAPNVTACVGGTPIAFAIVGAKVAKRPE